MTRYALIILSLTIGSLPAQDAPAPVKPAAVPKPAGPVKPIKPTPYRQVARHLNPDGDYYMYLNSQRFGQALSDLGQLLESVFKSEEPNPRKIQEIANLFRTGRAMFSQSGLSEVKALGMSSVQVSEKLHFSKMAFYHGPNQPKGRLWKIASGKPHELAGLKLMPKNTIAATGGDIRLGELWNWFSALAKVWGPEAQRELAKTRKEVAEAGLDLDAVATSFTGEVTFIITADPAKTHALPQNPKVRIPDISMMLAAQTKDDSFFKLLQAIVTEDRGFQKLKVGDTQIIMKHEENTPMRWWPTIAMTKGWVFLASNSDIVKDALKVKAGGPGLVQAEEFAQLSKGIPKEGNHMFFAGRKFTELLKTLIRAEIKGDLWAGQVDKLGEFQMHGVRVDPQALANKARGGAAGGGPEKQLLAMVDKVGPLQVYGVTVHHKDAMVVYSNASIGLGDLSVLQVAGPALLALMMVNDAQEVEVAAKNKDPQVRRMEANMIKNRNAAIRKQIAVLDNKADQMAAQGNQRAADNMRRQIDRLKGMMKPEPRGPGDENAMLLKKEKAIRMKMTMLKLRARRMTENGDKEGADKLLVEAGKLKGLLQEIEEKTGRLQPGDDDDDGNLPAVRGPFPTLKAAESDVRILTTSRDGKILLSGSRTNLIEVWDTTTRKKKQIKLPANVQAAAVAPNGKTAAVAIEGGKILLYTISGATATSKTMRASGRRVRTMCYLPDGKKLVVAGIDKKLEVWDIASAKPMAETKLKSVPRCLAVSPDGATIACGVSMREIFLLKATDLSQQAVLKGHRFAVKSVDFSPDGTQILSGSDDMTLRLWKRNGEFIRSCTGHFSLVTGVAFMKDGKRGVSSSMDGSLRIWDLRTGKELKKFSLTREGLSCLTLGADRTGVAVAARNGLIHTAKAEMLK